MSCSDPLEESDPRRPGVFLNVAIFKNSFKFMLLFTLLNTDDFWLWFDICRFQQDDGYNTNMLELYSLLHTAVLLIFEPDHLLVLLQSLPSHILNEGWVLQLQLTGNGEGKRRRV